jgi:hypothetical protein
MPYRNSLALNAAALLGCSFTVPMTLLRRIQLPSEFISRHRNNGIVPQFSIELSRDALREGRDTPLETAVEEQALRDHGTYGFSEISTRSIFEGINSRGSQRIPAGGRRAFERQKGGRPATKFLETRLFGPCGGHEGRCKRACSPPTT